jgi:hypothetical protein
MARAVTSPSDEICSTATSNLPVGTCRTSRTSSTSPDSCIRAVSSDTYPPRSLTSPVMRSRASAGSSTSTDTEPVRMILRGSSWSAFSCRAGVTAVSPPPADPPVESRRA